MKLIRLLKRITAIIILYTLQINNVAYRACRARGVRGVALAALVVTCRDVTQQEEFGLDVATTYSLP